MGQSLFKEFRARYKKECLAVELLPANFQMDQNNLIKKTNKCYKNRDAGTFAPARKLPCPVLPVPDVVLLVSEFWSTSGGAGARAGAA